jgi:glycosyltransferase involved in cell wall biosynthesis
LIVRILALTRYERLGSSSRVRFYQYIPYLTAQGMDIVTAPFFDDRYVRDLYAGQRASMGTMLRAYLRRLSVLLRRDSFDLLWVEKELLPWIPAWLETLFPPSRIPYVVDYDDAVFHRYDLHRSPVVRVLLGRKIDEVMRRAALVIGGNQYLVARATSAGARRVECLPSVVDVSQYAQMEAANAPVFRVGWIGSPVTAPYLDLVREALGRLHQDSPINIVLVGASSARPFREIPTDLLPWSESVERNLSRHFDAGIMPLQDGPFEQGKCGYKLIQYMASGLPVVASPVGVNREIVEPQVNGYLAVSVQDWLAALRELRDNAQKRNVMGQAGRQKAEQKYNLQVTAPRLFRLLSSLTKT